MEVDNYDGLRRICNHIVFSAIPFYRQRTGCRIRQRLLRGQATLMQLFEGVAGGFYAVFGG